VLPRAVREFVDETVAAAPPMSDDLRADLRLIIWGPGAAVVLPRPAEPEAA